MSPFRTAPITTLVRKRRGRFVEVARRFLAWLVRPWFVFEASLTAFNLIVEWREIGRTSVYSHRVPIQDLQRFTNWLLQQPDDGDLIIVVENPVEIKTLPWFYVRICQKQVSKLAAAHQRAWVAKE